MPHAAYDLTIEGVTADFFSQLEGAVINGFYKNMTQPTRITIFPYVLKKLGKKSMLTKQTTSLVEPLPKTMKAPCLANTRKMVRHIVIYILLLHSKTLIKTDHATLFSLSTLT